MSSNTHSAGLASANRIERGPPARLEDHDLAGLDVAHVLRADDVEAAVSDDRHPAVAAPVVRPRGAPSSARRRPRALSGQPAQHQRPEPVRVADADDPALVQDRPG